MTVPAPDVDGLFGAVEPVPDALVPEYEWLVTRAMRELDKSRPDAARWVDAQESDNHAVARQKCDRSWAVSDPVVFDRLVDEEY